LAAATADIEEAPFIDVSRPMTPNANLEARGAVAASAPTREPARQAVDVLFAGGGGDADAALLDCPTQPAASLPLE
jgi:hypothetical protein